MKLRIDTSATRRQGTYLRPVRSLPIRLITAALNTKLEKMVRRPAIPAIGNHQSREMKGQVRG
jgi:hypothetical protein